MNWILLVMLANLADSLRIYIDNYVSDVYFKKRHAFAQKLFYGLLAPIAGVIILILNNFDITAIDPAFVGLTLLSGLLSTLSTIPYFKALELDDSTNLGIFIQLSPILYIVLGWLFLGETFSATQLIAFAIILAAPMLIVLTARKRSRHTKLKTILYSSIYVLIAVIGNLIFVGANESSPSFPISIAFLLIGKGISFLLLVGASTKLRRRFFKIVKTSKYKVLRPMSAEFAIHVVKDFAYRGALIAAPTVAAASAASDSTEPIFIFFIGILLTLISPNFGREKLDRKSVLIHLSATIIAVVGIILLQL